MVSSDESSDDSEELVAKTRRIHHIRMQTQVEDAYHKYVKLYLNPNDSFTNLKPSPREQARKEKARKLLRGGSNYSTLTGKLSTFHNKSKSINKTSLQPVHSKNLTRAGPAPAVYSAMASTPPYRSSTGTEYDISTSNNHNLNTDSSSG